MCVCLNRGENITAKAAATTTIAMHLIENACMTQHDGVHNNISFFLFFFVIIIRPLLFNSFIEKLTPFHSGPNDRQNVTDG